MHKKVIIRCDAAEMPIIGTGHLYRCIVIYNFLKKKLNLSNKEIILIIKNKDKFSISNQILKSKKINFIAINSKIKNYSLNEINEINRFSSNLLIVDKWGSINKNCIYRIRKNHKKIVLLDDGSKNRNLVDLSLNSLKLTKNKIKNNFSGYNYSILPSYFEKNKYQKVVKKSIFIFFGGYDNKNLNQKLLKNLSLSKSKFRLIMHEKYQKMFKNRDINIKFYKSKDHYKNLKKSEIVICSGGLGMFDSIFFNKFTICIPQYRHQSININILNKKKIIKKLNVKKIKNVHKIIKSYYRNKANFSKLQKRQKKIINIRSIQNTLNLIYKCYEKNTRKAFI